MSISFEQGIQSVSDGLTSRTLPFVGGITADHATLDMSGVWPVGAPAQQIVSALQSDLRNLSTQQAADLQAVQALATTSADAYKAAIAALRKKTIDTVNAQINKAFDDLKAAGLKDPPSQPAILEAVKQVGQLAQGFAATAGSAFDQVDHAGSLALNGVEDGTAVVGKAFSDAGNAIAGGFGTVISGLGSIFGL